MREIKVAEVARIKAFEPGERPVFQLTFTDGDNLVVKAELRAGREANAMIPLMAKMMKQVSPQVKGKILVDAEFTALTTLSQDPGKFPDDDASQKYLALMIEPQARQLFSHYKMPFVANLTDFEKVAKNRGAAHMLLQLDHEALFNLGKIVAVDLFIGNHDRFAPSGKVQNVGNLLFQSSNGKFTPIGLDFYEAQGGASNLMKDSPQDVYDNSGTRTSQWPGMILRGEPLMRDFARKAIDGLNERFNEFQGTSSTPLALLNWVDATAFGNGMVKGALQLKEFLASRGGLPPGVRERMQRLGWPLPPPDRPTTAPPQTTGRKMYVDVQRKRGLPFQNPKTFVFEERII
jgi:hypothetical protein